MFIPVNLVWCRFIGDESLPVLSSWLFPCFFQRALKYERNIRRPHHGYARWPLVPALKTLTHSQVSSNRWAELKIGACSPLSGRHAMNRNTSTYHSQPVLNTPNRPGALTP